MATRKKPPRPVNKAPAPPEPAADPPAGDEPGRGVCPVVGVGASAGGLEAFKLLFGKMPADTGLAFVLIPHLDPTHESMMVQLLARYTVMPTVEAAEGMRVEADHVYVIPPNKYMAFKGGALHLTGPVERRGPQTSIDLFLRSLAEDRQEGAIAIILSGTGAHGALGLKAVKAQGGLAVVQDPATAQYDQMPRNAVATGLADFVVAPDQMPDVLLRYVQHFYLKGGTPADAPDENAVQLNHILALLRARTKFDFRSYRKRMLWRRVERRMSLNHLQEMAAYLEFLRASPDEVKALTRDLLISVTAFFRDPLAFRELASEAVPDIVERKDGDATIRVWVPGCATGEEAYSIAILFLERCAAVQKNCRVQVFASDIDDEAVQAARQGNYPEAVAADLTPERLEHFFQRSDEHTLKVVRSLREAVVFASQNLISDVPFSKLDLISCRNTLIYLEPEAQRKIIGMLHFALADGGYLLLGPSETIGRQTDLFETVSKKWRLYRRIGPSRPERVDFPITVREPHRAAGRAEGEPLHRSHYAELTQRVLVDSYAPAAVLINRRYEILYYHGPTGRYLDQPSGEPTQDLLRMAREGLAAKLRAVVHKAAREDKETTLSRARLRRDGGIAEVKVTVKPVKGSTGGETLLLVVFEDERQLAPARPRTTEIAAASLERELESELRGAREELQHTVEELESYNEELKSSNEEVMSMNEELQSTNEELETSKEELQSLNEELSTVNSQLQEKVAELEAANNDLANLLTSTDVATVFLDTAFRIKRFTPATTALLNLIPTDLGRPISDITFKFVDGSLMDDLALVLGTVKPLEKEVACDNDRWCLRRVLPYRTTTNKVEGLVVTFTDVTLLRQAAERQRRLAAVLMDANDAVSVYDFSGRITAWNRGAEKMYGVTEAESVATNVTRLIPAERHAEHAAAWQRLREGGTVDPWETKHLATDGRVLEVRVTLTALRDDAGEPVAVASTVQDISERKWAEKVSRDVNASLEERVAERTTELEEVNRTLQTEIAERKQAETALRETGERLGAVLNTAAEAILILDEDGTVESFNKAAEAVFGYSEAEIVGQNLTRLMAAPDRDDGAFGALDPAAGTDGAGAAGRPVTAQRQDGSTFTADLSLSQVRVGARRLFCGILRDTSERRALEREVLEAAAAEQQRIGQDLHDSVGQELTGLSLMADCLLEALPDATRPEADTARKIAGGIRRALKQARALTRGLIPVDVDAEGLMAALTDLAARSTELSGVRCTFACDDPVLIEDNRTAVHLFYIAQEAVTNALKHSQAGRVEIGLRADGRRLMLTVRDDGVGIPAASGGGGGMGLKIMRYRAGLINAALSVGAADGSGTLLTCVLLQGETHGGQQDEPRTENGSRVDR